MVRTLQPDKREKLLSAALKLFVAQGVQQSSTAEIAREAGTAAGTLFLYFPKKQDLIHALILKIGREQSEAINGLLDPSLSARDTFFTIWTGSIHWFLEHLDAYQYIQQVRDSGLIEAAVVQESNQYFRYYYTAIQKGLEEGCVQPYPLDLIGGFLYQDIVAVMSLLRGQTDSTQQDRYIHQGFEIFWNGIQAGNTIREGQQDEI